MSLVCEKNKCTACSACVDICPKKAIHIESTLTACIAVINEDKCINCGLCEKVCQVNNPLEKVEPVKWVQGWCNDEEIREEASSGGFATAMMLAFVQHEGIVYSCRLIDGHFRYVRAQTPKEIRKFSGSKYVKSSPEGVYTEIKKDIQKGEKVLFVGLPCHVAGVRKFIGPRWEEKLYTVDLICHGTPSEKILELFLKEHGFNLDQTEEILFRTKGEFKKYKKQYIPIENFGIYDKYSFAFLDAITYTENCYSCQYATQKRVSDITIGDSWGNALDQSEKEKGVSLALCNTSKGDELLKAAELHLEQADKECAIAHNGQLKEPSRKSTKREQFFKCMENNNSIDKTVWRLMPKMCGKAEVKRIFVKFGIIKNGTVFSMAVSKGKNNKAQ